MKQTIYDLNNKEVGSFELNDEMFTVVNKVLAYEACKSQLANKRQGNTLCKNRALVTGSTKKIYRQKGTGRARHSDKKAPIFVGGGKAFGPKPRSYNYSLPKKAKKVAVRTAIASKQKHENLIILKELNITEPKTKIVAKTLNIFGIKSGLIVTDIASDILSRAVRNIPNIKLIDYKLLNIVDVLKYEKLVVTENALTKIQEMLKP